MIFRITHRDNVPWILANGMHAPNGQHFDPNHRNIGNVDLIGKRSRRHVPIPPGGTLADYVAFYFTPYSIMMFNIRTGYGGVPQVPNEDLVIFVSSLPHVAELGIRFAFTNQHAYPLTAEYFNDLTNLTEVDWPILQNRDFRHDPDDPGKKERYQAEALIWNHVPVEALKAVCCYTTSVEQELQAEIQRLGLTLSVAMRPRWYFQ